MIAYTLVERQSTVSRISIKPVLIFEFNPRDLDSTLVNPIHDYQTSSSLSFARLNIGVYTPLERMTQRNLIRPLTALD